MPYPRSFLLREALTRFNGTPRTVGLLSPPTHHAAWSSHRFLGRSQLIRGIRPVHFCSQSLVPGIGFVILGLRPRS